MDSTASAASPRGSLALPSRASRSAASAVAPGGQAAAADADEWPDDMQLMPHQRLQQLSLGQDDPEIGAGSPQERASRFSQQQQQQQPPAAVRRSLQPAPARSSLKSAALQASPAAQPSAPMPLSRVGRPSREAPAAQRAAALPGRTSSHAPIGRTSGDQQPARVPNSSSLPAAAAPGSAVKQRIRGSAAHVGSMQPEPAAQPGRRASAGQGLAPSLQPMPSHAAGNAPRTSAGLPSQHTATAQQPGPPAQRRVSRLSVTPAAESSSNKPAAMRSSLGVPAAAAKEGPAARRSLAAQGSLGDKSGGTWTIPAIPSTAAQASMSASAGHAAAGSQPASSAGNAHPLQARR